MSSASWPALEVAGLTLGIREGVIGLIVLVALYMAFVLLRMRHLQAKAQPSAVDTEDVPTLSEPVVHEDEEAIELPSYRREPLRPIDPPANQPDTGMVRRLEQEIMQLRDEVSMVRGELASLRADMQRDLAAVRASQSVSPIYGDAMQLAISGYGPEMIAERCGIARAEAELVAALARSREEDLK